MSQQRWSDDISTDPLRHGWAVFDVNGSGLLEIQRVDEPDVVEVRQHKLSGCRCVAQDLIEPVFASDDDAVAYVMWRAGLGCPEARAAIRKIVNSWD